MTTQEKCIHIIEFVGNKSNWECWLETFLSWGKRKGYEKLLVGIQSTRGVDKVPMQDKQEALEGDTDFNKKVFKLNKFYELAYEDLILSTNTSSTAGKVEGKLQDST